MAKANKSVKTAGKAASAKFGKNVPKGKPVLRAIKGGKAAPAKSPPPKSAAAPPAQAKALQANPAMMKARAPKPSAVVAADVPVIALNLDPVKLSPAMAAYF